MGMMTNPSVINRYTKKYDFYFKKDYGQNFLIDENIANKIVDQLNVDKNDTVLEIGPGVGALTEILAQRAKKVVAIEIDPFLVQALNEIFASFPNVEIIHGDFLKYPIDNMEFSKAISNVPYYITSPIIFKLLNHNIRNIVLMIQKEMAQRLSPKLSTKDYSAFSINVDYHALSEYLFTVNKNVFMPIPKVDSSVVKLTLRDEKKVIVTNEDVFFKTVKAAFSTRRKNILNCLSAGFGISKDDITDILSLCNIDTNLRAENITIEEFGIISDKINEYLKNKL